MKNKAFKKYKEPINFKKIAGISLLVFGVLSFLLACFPNFLSLGKLFQGIAGVLVYPLSLLFALTGLALIMNLSYTLSKKYTIYIIFSVFCVLALIHTIVSSKVLFHEFAKFKHFKGYLNCCFHMKNGVSFGGVLLAIPVFFVRCLLGLGGAYVFFAIAATVFIGLTIDYAIYNRGKDKLAMIERKKSYLAKPTSYDREDKVSYSFSNKEQAPPEFEQWKEEETEASSAIASIDEETPVFNSSNEQDVVDSDGDVNFSFSKQGQKSSSSALIGSETPESRRYAKNILFNNATVEKEESDNSQPKSAHDILFGQNSKKVPNVFDHSNEERDDWRRQYSSKPLAYQENMDNIKTQVQDDIKTEPAPEFDNNQFNPDYNQNSSSNLGFVGFNGTFTNSQNSRLNQDRLGQDRLNQNSNVFNQSSRFNGAQMNQGSDAQNLQNDGVIKTSWGTYRPTSAINNQPETLSTQNNGAMSQPNLNNPRMQRDIYSRNTMSNINPEQQNQGVGFRDTIKSDVFEHQYRPNSRVNQEKTSISNFNKLEEQDVNSMTEFSSRLSSNNDRRKRGGDILSNASSLGIEMKETKPSFTSILDDNNSEKDTDSRYNSQEESIPSKPSRVEKISFESQLNHKYNAPPTSLLNVVKEERIDYSAEYAKKSEILEETLATFKIPAKVNGVVRGPKVTRYELSMPAGIPVGRVVSLDRDLSMALACRSGVRIEAPIPGKNAFGVEVENDKSSMVGLKELVESPEFTNFKGPLPVAVGKDISGKTIIKSLAKMVHLLVAGSTGSGKSVFLHSVIMSLMYKHSPEELRFIMIDPKRVEFNRYNRMPHLMLPEVVTDCTKAVNALTWAVKEMERRYELLEINECQKIEQYNELPQIKSGKEKRMPYIVIVVDELAELMGVAAKDVEGKIQRITQLGRASGIHMVVATQRPSVNIVTGTIKNNMPTRIAFSLTSYIDSRTILDDAGAEKLLGQGDMLYSGQDANQKIRLQGAFVSDEEIKKTLVYIKNNNVSVYDEDIQKSIYSEPEPEESGNFAEHGSSSGINDTMDEYMPQALKYLMSSGKASISMIQRRFSVGYARAARIIDQMERKGFIDAGEGNKSRKILITVEQFNELFGDFNNY